MAEVRQKLVVEASLEDSLTKPLEQVFEKVKNSTHNVEKIFETDFQKAFQTVKRLNEKMLNGNNLSNTEEQLLLSNFYSLDEFKKNGKEFTAEQLRIINDVNQSIKDGWIKSNKSLQDTINEQALDYFKIPANASNEYIEQLANITKEMNDLKRQLKDSTSNEVVNQMKKDIDDLNYKLQIAEERFERLQNPESFSTGNILNDWKSKGRESWDAIEKFTVYNEKTNEALTKMSHGTSKSTPLNKILDIIHKSNIDVDTVLHTHPENFAALSDDDIKQSFSLLKEGITKQAVAAFEDVMEIDFSKVNADKSDEIINYVEDEYQKIDEKLGKDFFSDNLDGIKEQVYTVLKNNKGNSATAPVVDKIKERFDFLFKSITDDTEYTITDFFDETDEIISQELVKSGLLQKDNREINDKYMTFFGNLDDAIADSIDDALKSSNLTDIQQQMYQKVLRDVFTNTDFLKEGVSSAIKIESLDKYIDTHSIINAAHKTVDTLADETAKAQDSHSPSKVAEKLGEYWGEGYAQGILKHKDDVESVVRELVDSGIITAQQILDDMPNIFGDINYADLVNPVRNVLSENFDKSGNIINKSDVSTDINNGLKTIGETAKEEIKPIKDLDDAINNVNERIKEQNTIVGDSLKGIAYHATMADYDKFDMSKTKASQMGSGMYLTDSKDVTTFTKGNQNANIKEVEVNLDKCFILTKDYISSISDINDILKTNLPDDASAKDVLSAIRNYARSSKENSDNFREQMLAKGYQGMYVSDNLANIKFKNELVIYDEKKLDKLISFTNNELQELDKDHAGLKFEINTEDLNKLETQVPSDEKLDVVDAKEVGESNELYESLLKIKSVLDDLTSDDNYDILGFSSLEEVFPLLMQLQKMDLSSLGNFYSSLKNITDDILDARELGQKMVSEEDWAEYENSHGVTPDSTAIDAIENFSSLKDFYENYGIPSDALDHGYFANMSEVIDELDGKFKELNDEKDRFSEIKINTAFLKELSEEMNVTGDAAKVLFSEFENIKWNTSNLGIKINKESGAFSNSIKSVEKIKSILNGTHIISDEDLANANNLLRVIRETENEKNNNTDVVSRESLEQTESKLNIVNERLSETESALEDSRRYAESLEQQLSESTNQAKELADAMERIDRLQDQLQEERNYSSNAFDAQIVAETKNDELQKENDKLEEEIVRLNNELANKQDVESSNKMADVSVSENLHEEKQLLEDLEAELNNVIEKIQLKTNEFDTERLLVLSVVDDEINALKELENQLDLIITKAGDVNIHIDVPDNINPNINLGVDDLDPQVDKLRSSLNEVQEILDALQSFKLGDASKLSNLFKKLSEVEWSKIKLSQSFVKNLGQLQSDTNFLNVDNLNKLKNFFNSISKIKLDTVGNNLKSVANGLSSIIDQIKDADTIAALSDLKDTIQILSKTNKLKKSKGKSNKSKSNNKTNNIYENDANNYVRSLESIQKKIQLVVNKSNNNVIDFQLSQEGINEATNKIEEIDNVISDIKKKTADGTVNENDIVLLKQLVENTQLYNKELETQYKNAKEDTRVKAIRNISKEYAQNTKWTQESRIQVAKWLEELQNINIAESRIKEISNAFMELATKERLAGNEGKSFFTKIKEQFTHQWSQAIARYVSLYDIIRYTREALSTIEELDTALVDLRKTTSMSSSELNDFYYNSSNLAKQMGVTTEEIINQASSWSRLGYSSKEASETMAVLSSQFASISPGMDTDTAQTGLVSLMKAYNVETEQVERQIMDNINILGNRFAETNEDIIEGMERAGATLSAQGESIQSSFALFTGAQEVIQNAETVGTAIKTLSLRIRGYDEETEELSDDVVEATGKVADLTKTASNNYAGVSLWANANKTQYRDLVDYLRDISEIFDEISPENQTQLLESLFGKRGASVGSAILKNFDQVDKALLTMENSAGSADAEMGIIQDSIEYKLNALKQTWVSTLQGLVDRGDIAGIIDALTKISEVLGKIIDLIGVLPALVSTVTAAISIKKGTNIIDFLSSISNSNKIDSAAIEKYNSILKETGNSILAATVASEGQNEATKALLQSQGAHLITTEQEIAANDALAGSMTAASVAGGILKTVLSSLVIGAVVAGISALIKVATKAWDDWNLTVDEAKENLKSWNEEVANMQDAVDEQKSALEKVKDSYDDYVDGVNTLNNKNINLTNEDYQEFISLNNELAELFPELKTGVDEEGNAILNLGDNAAEAAAKIESLIEAQERTNSIDIRTNWDETYKNNLAIVEGSENTIEDLKSEQDKLTSVVNRINENDINGTTLSYSVLPEDEDWEYAQDVYNAYMDAYDKIYNSMSETRQEELHDSLYNTSIQSRASNLSKSLRLDFTGWSDEEISNFETELGVFKSSILQDIDDLTEDINKEKSSLDQIYSDWAEQMVSGMHTSNEFLQYATTDDIVDAYDTLIRNFKDTEFKKINDEYDGSTEDFLNTEIFTDEMADLLSRSFENEDGEKFSFIDLFDPEISVEDMEFLVSQITSAAAELGIVLPISLQFTGVTNGQISDLAVSAGYARGESYQYKEELKNEAKERNLSLNLDEMTADEVQEFYDITSGAESVAEQIDLWVEYLSGANDELSETSKYIDQMNNAENFSYGNLDTLMQVYDDVKDAEDFDYSSILNNEDFKTAFKDFDSYEDFIKTITESPDDIEKCQKAFDDLATEAIYASKAFDDLTKDTAEATKKMLEQQGVANADEVVDWVLNVKNAWEEFADAKSGTYSTNLSEATEEEIIAFMREKGVVDETTTAMISFWAAKGNTLNLGTITVNGDISNLQSLTTQLGITSGALVEYLSIKGKIAEYESKLASGDYTGASKASLGTLLTWARQEAEQLQSDAQEQFNAALSGNTLNTKTNGSYSGRNSDSSGSSGSDSDSDSDSNEPTEIDWIEVKLERLQRDVDNLDKKVEQTWSNWSTRNKNLGKEIKKLTTLYNNQLKAADKYKDKFNSYVKENDLSSSIVKKIKDGSISIKDYDSDTADIIQKAQDYWEKYLEAVDNSNETQAEIIEKYVQKFELIEEKYESLIGMIDAKQDYYTTTRKDRIEANGGAMSYKQAAKYYGLLNNKEVSRQAYLKSEQSQLETQLNKLLSKGVSKNSTEYKDLATRLQEVKNAYQESINAVKENTYALLQVHWDEIDNYLSDISHNISDNDFIKNLLDAQGDLVDTDTAKFTDSGDAALATFLSNMEQDQEIVSAINKEIVELKKAYKNGEVGKDAYLERLEDLESQQQDAALDYYSQQDEVKSLWEEMYNALLDNLRDLIDTATNQLNTEKDAYEYQKTIQEKVDAISAYRKQLVALAGDDSEENSSILQKLKNSLNEAEQDLYETEWDRYISETSDVLNELYDNTEEWVNERLDDINGLLMDSNSIVQDGVSTIKTTIEDSISQIGITYLEPISTMLEYLGYGKDNDTKPTDTSTVDTTVSNTNNNSNNDKNNKKKNNNNDKKKKKKKKNNNDDKKSKGWFFVTNKSDKGNKSLDYNGSIVDRLKYKGYDSSFSNRKKYYSGMGLGKSSAYKGTASQNSKMLSWMKANGFKVGAKSIDKDQMAWTQEAGQEIIFRKSDGAMLTPLGKGDSVFTAEQTSALWNLSHGMINGFETGATAIANYPTTFNGGTVNNDINMSITLPNVTNYEEFAAQLKADTSFQKYIQQATLGSALNKNSLLTKRY